MNNSPNVAANPAWAPVQDPNRQVATVLKGL